VLASVNSDGGIAVVLGVVSGGYGSVHDVETLPHGVVAIRLGVRIGFCSGVETSAPLFRQLLSQRGECVASWSKGLRSVYLWKAWAFS